MSEALLRELAERIAREQLLNQWPIYLLMLALAFVGGALASYFGSYFKKRGEAFATKSDFDDLLTQLKATTVMTEEVKSKVSHTDWAAREQRTIRRMKLEELLQKIYELTDWQEMQKDSHFSDEEENIATSPYPNVERLSILYFPELRIEVMQYLNLHKIFMISLKKAKIAIIQANKNSEVITRIRNEFRETEVAKYTEQRQALALIENRCQVIMGQLISI